MISRKATGLLISVVCSFVLGGQICGGDHESVCLQADQFFEREVWPKVGERICLRCHRENGDAQESNFRIHEGTEQTGLDALGRNLALANNRLAFEEFGMKWNDELGMSVLLAKAVGKLDHGGGEAIKPDSTAFKVLSSFSKRLKQKPDEEALPVDDVDFEDRDQLFRYVKLSDPKRLLRRVTLSLCGRLPSKQELDEVEKFGMAAIEKLLPDLMKEVAFYVRIKEAFNDIFLTVGIEDNAETILSYDHFEKSRLWYQNFDLNHLPEPDRQKARWKLADVYRDALLQEPLRLIEFIVRNDRPFTELVTADYIMVSPYTARGYGIFEDIKSQFINVDDPFEYIPAKLNALKNRAGKFQESATGLYPHAGFLSMFHYLRRYPSTETNRNRLRARMFYQHFLGVDIMQLAPRSTDASAVASKYEIPTMQAADCVVCHRTIDPVAGVFQDHDFEGHIGPRKDGWYRDMFSAGFEGEDLPANERWRATQWLAERTIKDPRFAVAMVEHVYYILFGRKVMQAPEDIDDPAFNVKRQAYRMQRRLIRQTASQFASSGFNLKSVFQSLIISDFYRAEALEGLATIDNQDSHSAEMKKQFLVALDDLGVVRLLSPEQLKRKLAAIFGKSWDKLDGDMKILYGGIDSITVTERNGDPSGAMGAIQRIMANDVACYHVARDFRLEPTQRVLFPNIEPEVTPGNSSNDRKIREAIVYLYQRLHGSDYAFDDGEIDRTFQLFKEIVEEAKANGKYELRETYYCGGREEFNTPDPQYTIRAWRAVVSYMLRQHDFLYE